MRFMNSHEIQFEIVEPSCIHCGALIEHAPNGVITASGTTGCAGSTNGHEER
jgi:hypothetical protein